MDEPDDKPLKSFADIRQVQLNAVFVLFHRKCHGAELTSLLEFRNGFSGIRE